VTPRTRVYATVGVVTLAVAGGVAATIVTASRGTDSPQTPAAKGDPPLELDLGLRQDAEAVALRRAEGLYGHGQVGAAGRVFARYRSVQAEVGTAMAAWPEDTLARLGRLAAAHPKSSLVKLNLGVALFWAGQREKAVSVWKAARTADPDTMSAIHADDLLHPNYNRGRPTFVPSFQPPSRLSRLPANRQLEALARGSSTRLRLLYGVALQRLGRPVSAERVYAAAAARAPDDAEAQVAAAVGRFDKDHPERAFSRLGPLTKRFPHASTVRFHLGLLLLWLGQVKEGTRQLKLARTTAPKSPLGREAAVFLQKLPIER
jgi:predicted Zn-dependent protease